MINSQEVWNSFYTDELESIWKSEREALRKPAMIYYVLTQELQKVQESLAVEMKQFKHQVLSKEEHESTERRESVNMPLSQSELVKSPTITKQRNICFNKKLPKLLPLTKENMAVNIVESLPAVNNIFTSTVVSNKADMVYSTSRIENTPAKSFIEKGVKRNQKEENFKSILLTQLCKPICTTNSLSYKPSPNSKKLKSKDVNADESVCDVQMKTSTTSEKDLENSFKDRDEFSIARRKRSLVVHQTKPAQHEDDCMQLSGWSREDCKQHCESSNLPPEELCLKHKRKKFEPANDIFEGFWDIEMNLT